MAEDTDPLLDAVDRVSAGQPVDWDALDAAAATASQRAFIQELRVVAGVAQLARQTDAGSARPLTWGHLKLLEHVGSGSFGDVYRAWDSGPDREVALKLVRDRPSDAGDPRSSVIGEGSMLARVRHPNVVTVHGALRIGDTVGIWTEFVDGRSLAAIVEEQGPLDPLEVTAIGVVLCQALPRCTLPGCSIATSSRRTSCVIAAAGSC